MESALRPQTLGLNWTTRGSSTSSKAELWCRASALGRCGIDVPALPGWADVSPVGPPGLAFMEIFQCHFPLSTCHRQVVPSTRDRSFGDKLWQSRWNKALECSFTGHSLMADGSQVQAGYSLKPDKRAQCGTQRSCRGGNTYFQPLLPPASAPRRRLDRLRSNRAG